jgi:hypothetical protein
MIHNTHMSQFIPCTNFHTIPSTNITWTAGAVAGTISQHKAAAAETIVCTIPIEIPSNSIPLNGAKLASVEIDYQLGVADATSVTAVINKVTRGADLAVAVVAAQTFTQSPTAALSKVFDKHRLVLTITTPAWIDNDEYYLVQLTFVCPATTTLDLLGAVANFTYRA